MARSAIMKPTLSEKIRENLVARNTMSSISPTSIKIFIICHGSLKIITQDIARPFENQSDMEKRKKNMPKELRSLPESFSVFADTENPRNYSEVIARLDGPFQSNYNLQVSYKEEGNFFQFHVPVLYTGDLDMNFHTAGCYAGLPVTRGSSIKKILDKTKNPSISGIPTFTGDDTEIIKKHFAARKFMDYLPSENKTDAFDRLISSSTKKVSLMADKNYSNQNNDRVNLENEQQILMIVELDGRQIEIEILPRVNPSIPNTLTTSQPNIDMDKVALEFALKGEFSGKFSKEMDYKEEAIDKYIKNMKLNIGTKSIGLSITRKDILNLLRSLFNLSQTKIDWYESSCNTIKSVKINKEGPRPETEVEIVSSALSVINTYLKNNDIAFGKTKRKIKRTRKHMRK